MTSHDAHRPGTITNPRTALLVLAMALFFGCAHRPNIDPTPLPLPMPVAPAATEPPSTPQPESASVPKSADLATLAERVRTAVVSITTIEKESPSPGEKDLFDMFFGSHGAPAVRRSGIASGFVIDGSGYVVTNEHVVHDAVDLHVRLADDREFEASVVGRDPKLDVALIKLSGATNLPTLELGSSQALRVGEAVLAVGNPFGLGHSVTFGIVSAKGRSLGSGPYDDFIQTDASINPGNSGGPLVDMRGRVVGLNTVVRSGANGIGFAIPSDAIAEVLPALRDKGRVARGKLGLRVQTVTPSLARALNLGQPKGALIADLDPSGAGARAGLRRGDVILDVDGAAIVRAEDLARTVARNPPKTIVRVRFSRSGRGLDLRATLEPLEEEPALPKMTTAVPEGATKLEHLGLVVRDTADGLRVEDTLPGRDSGELEPGDLIRDANGEAVKNADGLKHATDRLAPGASVLLRIERETQNRYGAIAIGPKHP
jgi:serine protease Do